MWAVWAKWLGFSREALGRGPGASGLRCQGVERPAVCGAVVRLVAGLSLIWWISVPERSQESVHGALHDLLDLLAG